MHPFSVFIESLRIDGFQVTLYDHHCIGLMLRTSGAWQLTQLRDMLAALLVKTPAQDIIFQRRFDTFFKEYTVGTENALVSKMIEFYKTQEVPQKPNPPTSDSPTPKIVAPNPKKRWFKFFLLGTLVILLSVCSVGYYWLYRPQLSMQPNALDFDEQVFHTNTQQTIEITNNGLAPLTIHQITLSNQHHRQAVSGMSNEFPKPIGEGIANADAFKFINKCPETLASDSRCTIDVQFTPQQAIDYTATLTIHNNTGLNHLSLSGRGLQPLLIQPRQLGFGEQSLEVQTQKTLKIVNAGVAPLTIEQLTLPDTEAFKIVTDQCSGTTLTDNACTIDIQFTPQQTIAYTTTLTIPHGTDKSTVSLSGRGIAVAHSQRRYPDVPFIKDITALPNPAQDDWKTYAGITAGLLLILLGYLVWLWHSRRFSKKVPSPPYWDKTKPRLFSMGEVGGKPQPRLSHTTLDQLAESIDYFYSEQTSKRLDIKRSIRESVQNLVPTLIFRPRKQVRTVVILEDALAKPLAWNPMAQELANGLKQRRITVLSGQFEGSPQQFYSAEGTGYHLKQLSSESNNYLLLIFSDGKSFRYQRDKAILAALAEWEQVAWMELREVRAWDASATLPARFGLPVYPATAKGLVQAIGGFLSESRRQNDFSEAARHAPGLPVQIGDEFDDFAAYVKELLDDALPWAQCCAMLQPISLGLADALRCRFFAQLPPERIERLFALPNTINTVNGLHFATPIVAILRLGFLRDFTDAEQEDRLRFILAKLEAAKPKDEQSPAHLAWEWRYQRVNLELNPEEALQRLSELANTPLGQTVRAELENTTANNCSRSHAPAWERIPRRASVKSKGRKKQEVLIPLRKRPKSPIALQQLQQLAKHSGIKKSFILPLKFAHWMIIGLLTGTLLGLSYAARESYLTAQPQPPYNVKLANADSGVLAWGILSNKGALTPVRASEKLPLPPDSEQLTFLSHNGFIKTLKLATLTNDSRIELGYKEQIRPCTEHFPKIGLTVQRCVEEPTASAVVIPTWYDSLEAAALPNRLLSIGLDIQTTPSEDSALQALRQTLLETHSVDLFYRIRPASDGSLHLPDAFATIQTQLAPWHPQSQLILWAVGEQANEIQLNDFMAAFGSVWLLAQRRDLSWVAAVQQLFTASDSPIIAEAEIRAALGQPVEQVALIRQRDLATLLKRCQQHLKADRLTTGLGGNAFACYQKVLQQVPTHAEALAGLENIEGRYVALVENALTQGQQNQAKEYLASLRRVNSNSQKLVALEMQLQLGTCEQHFQADRLTTGVGGTALACYQEVLAKEPQNAEALAGLEKIEARYVTLITRALDMGKVDKAEAYLGRLRTLNPQSPLLAETQLETQFQLVKCEKYFQTDNLITGEDGNALACYKEVLKKEPTHVEALAGLAKIEAHYRALIETAWNNKQLDKVDNYLAKLRQVNPTSEVFAEVDSLLQTALVLETETKRYQTNTENALKAEKLKEARQNLQRLRQVNPDLPVLLTLQQRVLDLQNREERFLQRRIAEAIADENITHAQVLLADLREVNPNSRALSLPEHRILSSYTGSYALLIGESEYTNGWFNLETIPSELQKVQSLLISKGFHVEKSLNLNAQQLRARFKTFINQYGFYKDNRLLFFYSGHGHTFEDKGYIVPTDAPNPNADEIGFLQKAVDMNQVLAWARRIKAKHALFLFDSCFSGTVFQTKSLPKVPPQISQAVKLPVRQFITACSAGETAPAKSVFTPAFIDALRFGWGDMNKDGYVTGQELALYLWDKVAQHTNQSPQYGKINDHELSRGDFVFVVGGAQIYFRDGLKNGGKGPEMVWIPAGSFRMGDLQGGGDYDERPVHSVSVKRFAMGRYEVTFAEYDQFAEATGRRKPDDFGWGRGNRPVVDVSWDDATAYARWLSRQTGKKYSLPTEEQWEYAARAGTKTKYWWGNEMDPNQANCDVPNDHFKHSAPVGSFGPNPFGLHDTVGNVWEWTCSVYQNKYRGLEKRCTNKHKKGGMVVRGGSWDVSEQSCRSANRAISSSSDNWHLEYGIRVVCCAD